MTTLITVACVILAAMMAWKLASARAATHADRLRNEMTEEIRYWQGTAERARHHAAQLARDAANWAAGHRQGRDDVIAIMPMIVKAEAQRSDCSCSCSSPEMTNGR
jgi:hypothetical protein